MTLLRRRRKRSQYTHPGATAAPACLPGRRNGMERYIFFTAEKIPPALPVMDVPTSEGFVWVEVTQAAYDATLADLDLARQLAAHLHEVLATRLASPAAPHLEEA